MGRWTETDNPRVCLAYKLNVESSLFSIFSFLEALEELYTPWAMVGSRDQRYMGSCSTVELKQSSLDYDRGDRVSGGK